MNHMRLKLFTADAEHNSDEYLISPSVGESLEVFWPIDNQFYSGVVQSVEDNMYVIAHDDCDKE